MIKPIKSTNLLSLGLLSAFSAATLIFSAGAVKAQTNSQMGNEGTTPMNQSPTQLNQSPAPVEQPAVQSVPNSTPSQETPLSRYSLDQAPLLAYGSEGTTVRDVQTFLTQRGLYNGPIDGIYGVETSNAVKQFQQANNLTSDGIIGQETWQTMLNDSNQASNL